jgi:hypothetical protein
VAIDADAQLEKHSIIEVQECICNVIQNRKIVILLNLKVCLHRFHAFDSIAHGLCH